MTKPIHPPENPSHITRQRGSDRILALIMAGLMAVTLIALVVGFTIAVLEQTLR